MMIAIKDFEMPNTCGGCPCCIYTADEKRYIGYCHTSDDDFYCKALDRFMEYDEVDGGVDILGKPSDCPLVEAIPKADYENRLKTDMIAMLEELQLKIEEKYYNCDICEYYEDENDISGFNPVGSIMDITDLIQEKINDLKGE